jgi:hypothetical protein
MPLRGSRRRLSLPRTWIADLMAVSRGLPTVAIERRMNLAPLAAARRSAVEPPSWLVLLTKAYALVARRMPPLRQAYVSFPWPHLFEADENLASVSVARDFEGEPAVFFGRLSAPERQSLRQLSEHVRSWKQAPIETVPPFARLVKYSRYPLPIRRLFWRLGMHLSGRTRIKSFGTFGVTALGNSDCRIARVLAPTTSVLSFGPIDQAGRVDVRLTFDHRVLDGMTAVAALVETENVLNDAMVVELTMASAPAKAA